jgi:hypothetical protein
MMTPCPTYRPSSAAGAASTSVGLPEGQATDGGGIAARPDDPARSRKKGTDTRPNLFAIGGYAGRAGRESVPFFLRCSSLPQLAPPWLN